MNKRCTKCNIEKTIDEYHKHGKQKNGGNSYNSRCKGCRKQHYEQNKEQTMNIKRCEIEGSAAKRWCTKCNIEKPIDEYHKTGKKKNGDIKYHNNCKACHNQYKRQYYQDNKVHKCVQEEQLNSKVCSKCNIEKKLNEYNKKGKKKNVGSYNCIACQNSN